MATSSTTGTECSEWLVRVPDFPGVAERRAAVFPQHIEKLKTDPAQFWVFGGATLAEPVDPGRPPHITGSAMLIFAPTREDVLDRLKNDPLTKEGVWDINNVQIYPFFRPKRVPV
ncbi:hypothetical protein K4K54_010789 [Colletotrichum sp. SAR 10_86]|nr:hypothetical protein K4K54_010789 [Colletotrichum sp. SAR 10_86]KAI8317058.1 hypothetical protein K4K59_011862 [Colletotrichum sp. SAR11_240]